MMDHRYNISQMQSSLPFEEIFKKKKTLQLINTHYLKIIIIIISII